MQKSRAGSPLILSVEGKSFLLTPRSVSDKFQLYSTAQAAFAYEVVGRLGQEAREQLIGIAGIPKLKRANGIRVWLRRQRIDTVGMRKWATRLIQCVAFFDETSLKLVPALEWFPLPTSQQTPREYARQIKERVRSLAGAYWGNARSTKSRRTGRALQLLPQDAVNEHWEKWFPQPTPEETRREYFRRTLGWAKFFYNVRWYEVHGGQREVEHSGHELCWEIATPSLESDPWFPQPTPQRETRREYLARTRYWAQNLAGSYWDIAHRIKLEPELHVPPSLERLSPWYQITPASQKPSKQPNTSITQHCEWLARYQVAGESFSAIADDVGMSRQSVTQAIKKVAELIELPLKPSKAGRPKSKD